MLKPVVFATAGLAIAGFSIAHAQQHFGGYGDGTHRFQHSRLSVDDVKAFDDARIAALRAGLELTPDQAKNWGPFEAALRDLVKLRIQHIQARESGAQQQPEPGNPFNRLQRRADRMSQFATGLKHLADTGVPLYQSLNEAQQRRFRILAHMLRPHWMRARFGGGWHHFWRGHDSSEDQGRDEGMMRPGWHEGGHWGMHEGDGDKDRSQPSAAPNGDGDSGSL